MRPWLTEKTRAEFAEIYDCEPHEVEARLEAHQPKRFMALCIEQSGLMASIEAVEPLTVATVMGAVNLLDAVRADERARIAVEGAGIADAHWHSPVTSPRHLDAVALGREVA